mmetsp:Transcript_44173/g.80959  ORF Transcript_44173/g.80959 Transcript_44173/m.80959 type:complete len:227 (-) Transcript_44173:6-686(-)
MESNSPTRGAESPGASGNASNASSRWRTELPALLPSCCGAHKSLPGVAGTSPTSQPSCMRSHILPQSSAKDSAEAPNNADIAISDRGATSGAARLSFSAACKRLTPSRSSRFIICPSDCKTASAALEPYQSAHRSAVRPRGPGMSTLAFASMRSLHASGRLAIAQTVSTVQPAAFGQFGSPPASRAATRGARPSSPGASGHAPARAFQKALHCGRSQHFMERGATS